jgi:hypothetical protein
MEGEYNSILASPLAFLASFDHFIRPHQHVRRNRDADLLGRLQVDDQLKLCRLFDW